MILFKQTAAIRLHDFLKHHYILRVSQPVLQLQLLTAPISRPNYNNLLPRRQHEPHAEPLPHISPTHLPAEMNLFGRNPCAHHPTQPLSKLHSSVEISPDTIKETGCSFLNFFFFELVDCKHNYRRGNVIRDRNVTFSLWR